MTPDVNILVAASRLDHPHHGPAIGWLTDCLEGKPQPGPIGLCLLPSVVAGFLRLVTHPRIFPEPTPPADAIAFVDALKPHATNHSNHIDDWPGFRELILTRNLKANAIPDAWIAAQVLARHEVLVTFDRDFQALLPEKHLRRLSP